MSHAPYSRRSFLTAIGLTGAAVATASLVETVGAAAAVQAAIPGPGSYTETWDSIDQHPAAPEWFQDAKFGIYFHWGVFATPAYDYEWYPRNMYIAGSVANVHHVATYGEPVDWPYHNFIDGARDKAGNFVQFAPKLVSAGGRFDPQEWAQLFADAGARFAGPVAEHHDGYSMWDSKVNEWNSVARGPKLNLLQLFSTAIRAKGLKLFVAMHHAYHMNGFYDHVPAQSDPSLRKLYGQLGRDAENQLWFDKLKEVIDAAQPDVLYQDFTLDRIDEAQRLKFAAYYYNQAVAWGREVVATYKDGFNDNGEMTDYERGGPADIRTPYWLTDDAISSSSWSYTTGMKYYPANAMLHALIDRVSKNGNMVLNISPMPDGTIPQGQRDALLFIGDYLRRYGESIYSTRAWSVYGEGPTKMGGGIFQQPRAGTADDIRYTRGKSGSVLYATVLGWPAVGSRITLASLAAGRADLSGLRRVELLGDTAGTTIDLPTRTQTSTGLQITLPSTPPFTAPAYVVRLTFAGPLPTPVGVSAVSVYSDTDYAGTGAALTVGRYTTAQLRSAGLADNSISSLLVAPGFQVVGYPDDAFGGTASSFTTDTPSLIPAGVNDTISSLRVTFNPGVFFRLTNVTDGLALDGGGNVAAGSGLKQWTWDGSPNLQWQLIDLGDGFHRLVNRTSGMAVDGWGDTTVGSTVRQALPNASLNQQWEITDQGGGQYRIANRATGLVLDGGGDAAPGAPVKQWTAVASTNLQWTLTAL